MEGIMFLTDDQNKKRYVQIDIDKYGDVVEDVLDSIDVQMRKDEESYPAEDILKELKEKGNLDKYV